MGFTSFSADGKMKKALWRLGGSKQEAVDKKDSALLALSEDELKEKLQAHVCEPGQEVVLFAVLEKQRERIIHSGKGSKLQVVAVTAAADDDGGMELRCGKINFTLDKAAAALAQAQQTTSPDDLAAVAAADAKALRFTMRKQWPLQSLTAVHGSELGGTDRTGARLCCCCRPCLRRR